MDILWIILTVVAWLAQLIMGTILPWMYYNNAENIIAAPIFSTIALVLFTIYYPVKYFSQAAYTRIHWVNALFATLVIFTATVAGSVPIAYSHFEGLNGIDALEPDHWYWYALAGNAVFVLYCIVELMYRLSQDRTDRQRIRLVYMDHLA